MVRIYAKTLTKEAIIEINKKFENETLLNEGNLKHIVYKVANTRGIDRKAMWEQARKLELMDAITKRVSTYKESKRIYSTRVFYLNACY